MFKIKSISDSCNHFQMTSVSATFLINTHVDPLIIKINGRVGYTNCSPINELFKWISNNEKKHCIIDFSECTGIDSTFLGILAGLALDLKKANRQSDCQLCNLNERNYELIQNMGLHRIFESSRENLIKEQNNADWFQVSGIENQRPTKEMILKAHENLIAINSSNKNKFEEVVAFLKKQSGIK